MKDISYEPAAIVKEYQEKGLKSLLHYVNERSPYYKKLFIEQNIDIGSIQSLDDLIKIPVTTKEDLQRANYEFLCVPRKEIIDYSVTSGSLGKPVSIFLTEKDLERLAYNEYLSLGCTGAGNDTLFQLMTTIDKRFMAGLAYFMGARKLGAGIIRIGSGSLAMQWSAILEHKPGTLICVPSFVLQLLDYAEYNNINYRQSSVKKIICIGENIRRINFINNALADRILNRWDVKLYSTYASTEMGCAFTECDHGVGGHHHPALLIIECLDENNDPVAPGQPGELTITTLGVEGMPLLRFKTGDICILYEEACACGRTSYRISPVIGRKQHMIKYKGTTLFPPAIADVLDGIPLVKNYVIEVSGNEWESDDIKIYIGADHNGEEAFRTVQEMFRSVLRVSPVIAFMPVAEVEKMQFTANARKPILFIDKRRP